MNPYSTRDNPELLSLLDNQSGSTSSDDQAARDETCVRLRGRVLLVDDSRENQRILKYHLEKLGLIVVVADDGLQATIRVASEKFDLILMDLQMPVLDGFQATEELRRMGTREPIIALSALKGPEVIEKCLTAGCDGFLHKPINFEQFVHEMCRFFSPADRASR